MGGPLGADGERPCAAAGSPFAPKAGLDAKAISPIHRSSSVAFVLAGVALITLVVTGWTLLTVTRGGDLPSPSSSQSTAEPISEIAIADREAPVDVSRTTLTDSLLKVADLRGSVLVLNVWGPWCVPCRDEAPTIARLSPDHADQRVPFVGVNVRDSRALAFEERYGTTYPSIEDRNGTAVLVPSRYATVQAVPATLVLDREGGAASRVIGVVGEATLRAVLDNTFAEKRVGSVGGTGLEQRLRDSQRPARGRHRQPVFGPLSSDEPGPGYRPIPSSTQRATARSRTSRCIRSSRFSSRSRISSAGSDSLNSPLP